VVELAIILILATGADVELDPDNDTHEKAKGAGSVDSVLDWQLT
jgi:hypothetical protein